MTFPRIAIQNLYHHASVCIIIYYYVPSYIVFSLILSSKLVYFFALIPQLCYTSVDSCVHSAKSREMLGKGGTLSGGQVSGDLPCRGSRGVPLALPFPKKV